MAGNISLQPSGRAMKALTLHMRCSVQAWTLSELFPLLIMVMKGEDCEPSLI